MAGKFCERIFPANGLTAFSTSGGEKGLRLRRRQRASGPIGGELQERQVTSRAIEVRRRVVHTGKDSYQTIDRIVRSVGWGGNERQITVVELREFSRTA